MALAWARKAPSALLKNGSLVCGLDGEQEPAGQKVDLTGSQCDSSEEKGQLTASRSYSLGVREAWCAEAHNLT